MAFEGIKKIELERLIRRLEVLGVEYAIIANGTQYGTLKLSLEVEKPARKRNAKRFESVRENVRKVLSGMAVGDVATFLTPPGLEPDAYRSHISNQARGLFGPADTGYKTTVNYETKVIELLRLS
jgi:hypothetical protein